MKIALLCFLSLLLITGCNSNGNDQCSGKQVTCPAFDDNSVLQWIPYKENDELIFLTASGEQDTFYIKNVTKSGTYQETVNASRATCAANASWGNYNDSLNIQVSQQTDQYTSAVSKYVNINIKGQAFSGYGFTDTGLNVRDVIDFKSSFHAALTLNSRTFNNVQILEKDTTALPKTVLIYKIYFAKNTGLAAYENFPDRDLWIKK